MTIPARRLPLGLCQYGITAPPSFAAFANKLDATLAAGAAGGAGLLVLPEYACMEAAAAFSAAGDAGAELAAVAAEADRLLGLFADLARRHRVWLLPGSMPWPTDTGVRNRAPLIRPDGRLAFQEKRVMTRFESESWRVEPGEGPAVFDTDWGRIGVAICYDVEFPMLVRAQVEAGAWVVLAPSCTDTLWGFNRVRLAARARALENQCYVAVAPTVGEAPGLASVDVNRGYAAVFGPVDRGFPEDGVLARGTLDAAEWVQATLDPARLDEVRRDGGVRNHRDWPASPGRCRVVTVGEDADVEA